MNLWSFEVVTSLFDDKFLEKQLFFLFFLLFWPKSSNINKCWVLWQILLQIFSWDPKVPCLQILLSQNSFWRLKNILNWKKKHVNKKSFLNKKKQKKAPKKSSPEICEKMKKKNAYWISIFFGLKKILTFFFFFSIQNFLICSKRVVRP